MATTSDPRRAAATLPELWEWFERHQRQTLTWGSLQALAGWDQQTGMPPEAAADRQDQEAALARLIHERSTDPALAEVLEAPISSRTVYSRSRCQSVSATRRAATVIGRRRSSGMSVPRCGIETSSGTRPALKR